MKRSSFSAEQLRLLVDAQTEYAMFILGVDARIQTWNRGAARIKGYAEDEIIGEHLSVFFTPEDRERGVPESLLDEALSTGRAQTSGWRVRKDGTRFWADVVLTALVDDEGTHVGFGKVTRDMTARRLAEEQLASYRLMVSSVRDYAIFMLDPGGRIRTWNRGAEHLKGYTEDEVVGRHFSLFYTDEDRARNHPEQLLAAAVRDGSTEAEGWRVRRDGTRFWGNVVITAVRDDDGELVGFAKVTRDLSERRSGEQRLRELAAELERSNAALQEFASAAAHDLVEPLHTMSGLAELVARIYGEGLDDEGRAYLSEITEGSLRMRGMVDALLDYARASHGEVTRLPVAVAPVVESVLGGLRARIEEGGLQVAWDPAQMPTVRADAGLLQSILGNLVANALKFSPEPGSVVTISAARDEDDAAMWRISVEDQGIGIAPEQQERVFDLFQRLHPRETFPGTGLGLALCRRLVDRLGGRIGVASTPGEGSRFWFTLEGA